MNAIKMWDENVNNHLARLRARRYATAIEEHCDECGGDGRHDVNCPEWVCGHGATGCPYCTSLVAADDGPGRFNERTQNDG